MRLAMPIWRDRLSPVMDAATRLLIVEFENRREIARTEESIAGEMTPQVARRLAELGVSVLICGGISQPLFTLITAQGITVIPWMTGEADEILAAYMANRLERRRFLMPGCHRGGRGRGHRPGWGRGRGHGRGTGQGRQGRGAGRMDPPGTNTSQEATE